MGIKFSRLITTIILTLFIFSINANAEKKVLRWAADAESGAPYVFQDPDNPDHLIGFEVDIIDDIAKQLNMKPVHVQNQWDGLIPGLLGRNDYDVIINGIEITADRMKVVNFSKPYFVTFLQMVVRKTDTTINFFSDFIGKKIGTLSGSYAERLMIDKGGIDVRGYESELNSFIDLKNKRLDGVLIDYPVALSYAANDPKLKFVGAPIGVILYGITLRKKDTVLLREIDKAIMHMWKTGEIERILKKWGIWDEKFMGPMRDTLISVGDSINYVPIDTTNPAGIKRPHSVNYISLLPELGVAALKTIFLSITSMILAVLLGLFVALVRIYSPPPFSQLALIFIEVIRGTPLLIQLYFIFYALPSILGVSLSPYWAAIIGLGVNYAAYEAENYRAGIFSVPRGQMEAAIALGMTRNQALRHIIVPQAIRLVMPPLTNDFISLLKDSSLVSVITIEELTKTYTLIVSRTFDFIGTGILVAAIYLLIGLPFVKLARMAENKFTPDKRKQINP